MASTLELVGKLKAQLAESRQDLLKERPEQIKEPPPKDGSTLAGGSVSSASPSRVKAIDFQEEIASLREEFRRHSSDLTAKMTSLAFSTRQLSQQLIREREDRLAFQREVKENRVNLPAQPLLESSMVALREDLEHLSAQFQALQQGLEGSVQSMAMQLSSVATWVQEKLEAAPLVTKEQFQSFQEGMCLSPILEDREDAEVGARPELDVQEKDELPMSQVVRNIATEMPPIVKQMAEKSQLLLARLEEEHRDRVATEAHFREALQTLSHRVEDACRKRFEEPVVLNGLRECDRALRVQATAPCQGRVATNDPGMYVPLRKAS